MPHGASPRHVRKAKPKAPARPARAETSGGKTDSKSNATPISKNTTKGRARPEATPRLARRLETAGEPVRLQRLLAGAGFGSRREVEALISEGRVTVNGEIAQLGDRARPGTDDIRLDGERVLSDRPIYWIVNKPRGVVTTVRDDSGRRTVLDLIPRKLGRVFPVGRLDVETQGLLLLTNDGETAYAMLHPSLGNEREYRVNVKGEIDTKAIARLEKGVNLEEGRTAPGRVRDVRIDPKTQTSTFSLTLIEGRNRQIRRSLLILGFPVRRLVRERIGPLRLDGLAVGEARPLDPEERTMLLAHVARLKTAEPAPRRTTTRQPKLGLSKPRLSGRPERAGATRAASRPERGAGGPARPQRGASSRKGVRK